MVAGGGCGGFNPASDTSLIAWLNPTALAVLGPTKRVTSVLNQGSSGGLWLKGENSQVTGQGLGPVFSQTALSGGGPGFIFDGTQKTILKIPCTVAGSGLTACTIMATIKTTSAQGDSVSIPCGVGSSSNANPGFELNAIADLANATLFTGNYFDNTGTLSEADNTATVAQGIYVVTIISTPSHVVIRVNGTQKASVVNASTDAITLDQATVGGYQDSTAGDEGEYFSGVIGHVMIWNKALSAAELARFEGWLGSTY